MKTSSSSRELSIHLEDNTVRYGHGDTVIGALRSKAPTVSPDVKLTLSIYGQSVCRVETGGMGRNVWIGTLPFFGPKKTGLVLHEGKPLHIQSGEEYVWPFAITIPSSYDRATLLSKGLTQKQSFLPLGPDEVASQPLPPTFNFKGRATAKSLGAFVEYYLQADLVLQRHGSSKTKTYQAIQPLRVEKFSPDPPIVHFKPSRLTFSREVSSWRLVPEMENTELSFMQKMQKSMGSSKVPKLSFKMHVEIPTVLQVGNENHIPLNVGIEPIWNSSSEFLRGIPQRAKLVSFTLRVRSETGLKFYPDRFVFGHLASGEGPSKKEDLLVFNSVRSPGTDIYIPCAGTDAASTGHKGETPSRSLELINVGKLLDFRLRQEAGVYPTFTSHNIKHGGYRLSWEMVCVLAGEEVEVYGEQRVDILPASSPYPGG